MLKKVVINGVWQAAFCTNTKQGKSLTSQIKPCQNKKKIKKNPIKPPKKIFCCDERLSNSGNKHLDVYVCLAISWKKLVLCETTSPIERHNQSKRQAARRWLTVLVLATAGENFPSIP